jgi:hypothetical protein
MKKKYYSLFIFHSQRATSLRRTYCSSTRLSLKAMVLNLIFNCHPMLDTGSRDITWFILLYSIFGSIVYFWFTLSSRKRTTQRYNRQTRKVK